MLRLSYTSILRTNPHLMKVEDRWSPSGTSLLSHLRSISLCISTRRERAKSTQSKCFTNFCSTRRSTLHQICETNMSN